ncbi:MAG: methyltransferase domain-containing protein, partial [Bacteroidota bacterium]
AQYEGWDIEEDALTLARANAEKSGSEISFRQGDVRKISLTKAKVDRIISNPPWGRQVASDLDLAKFYEQMYQKWKRLLRKEGILVILTDQEEVMGKLLKRESVFQELGTHQLSLFGSVVRMYVWKKVS